MGLFTKDKTAEKIQAAVEEAVSAQAKELDRVRSMHWREIESLREQVQALQADRAERETEMTRDWAKLLDDHRKYNEAGVKGLLSSIQSIRDEVRAIPPVEMPDPADLRPLQKQTEELTRELGEVSDLATYLLASPQEIVKESVPDAATSTLAAFQGWVRPMGR